MFHDKKFCKKTLLKSTAFSPLTRWRKIFDAFESMEQSKKSGSKRRILRAELSITPLLAGLLAACGDTKYISVGGGTGGGGGGTGGGGTFNALPFNVYVADGIIEGARVYIDVNGDGLIDAGDTLVGTTDSNGRVTLGGEHAGRAILVDISGALDLFTGETLPANIVYSGISSTTGGSDVVVSPITTIIGALISGGMTAAEASALIFGANNFITPDALNDADSYILPVNPNTLPANHPSEIAKLIATQSLTLQLYLEQENGVVADVLALLEDANGLSPTDDLDAAFQARLANLLNVAADRAKGKPIANPDITRGANEEDSVNEDTDLVINEADWGFRDPVGNTVGATASSFAQLRILSITDGNDAVIRGVLVHIDADGTETEFTANDDIPAAQIDGLIFRPTDNYFGAVEIVYNVYDGQARSTNATLTFTVTSVNDDPTDIVLTGDRTTDSTGDTSEVYVLFNGVLTDAMGVAAGALTTADFETNLNDATGAQVGIAYALTGDHGDLFQVSATGIISLKSDATPLNAGESYTVIITATDTDGGTYAETFTFVQGGLYLEQPPVNANTVRIFSNGVGLVNEEKTDSAGSPVALGTIGIEGDAGQTVTYTLVAGAGGDDNANVMLDAATGAVTYIGADSGDYDITTGGRETIQIRVNASYMATETHVATFNGQTLVDASGSTTDADVRQFAYIGGGITVEDAGGASNRAPDATISSNLLAFSSSGAGSGTQAQLKAAQLAAAVDGVKGNTGDIGYSVHPDATGGVAGTVDGKNITFNFGDVTYIGGSFVLYNRNTDGIRIDGSTVQFKNNGDDVGAAFVLSEMSEDATGNTITVNLPDATEFDEVVITFAGDAQNFSEIEVLGRLASDTPSRTVDVAAGTIYIDDATTGRTITFAAATDLVVDTDADSFIIVTDIDAATNVGVVQAVTELPTTGLFFVIGTVQPLDNDTETTAGVTAADAVAATVTASGLTFTADTAGVGGNAISVVFALGTDAGTGVATVTAASNVITITVNAGGATTAQIVTAIEASTAAAALVDVVEAVAGSVTVAVGAASLAGGAAAATAVDAVLTAATALKGGLTYTADVGGRAGDDIVVAIEIGAETGSGVATANGVVVTGNRIVVTLNAAGATTALIKAAIDANTEAAALVDVVETTAGTITAPIFANLAGGGFVGAAVSSTGTAQTTGPLEWTRVVDLDSAFVINLINIDDNAPIFTSTDATTVEIVENTDREDAGVIFTAIAADADGDVIVYTLMDTFSGLFEIDAATGEIRFATDRAPNYEAATSYDLTITATSTFPAEVEKTATQTLTVTVTDTNEAATAVRLTSLVVQVPSDGDVPATGIRVGALTTADEDAGNTHTYALTGADASLFAVNAGALWFTGATTDLKGPGQTYDIIITATDDGTPPLSFTTDSLDIVQSGLFIQPPTPTGTTTVPAVVYTGGAPLLAENANGVATNIDLGAINDLSGSTVFTTATTGFTVTNGNLFYTGAASGDFEAEDSSLTVVIEAQTTRQIFSFDGREAVNSNGVNATGGTFAYDGAITITGTNATVADGTIYAAGATAPITYIGLAATAVTANQYIVATLGDHDSDTDTDDAWYVQIVATIPATGTFHVLGQVNAAGNAIILNGTAVTPESVALPSVTARNAVAEQAAVDEAAATIVVGGITFTADTAGVGGNAITIAIVIGTGTGSGVAATGGVVVTANAIVITLNAGGATTAEIITALEANDAASALVDVVETTAGSVTADVAATNLAGGVAAAAAVEAQAAILAQVAVLAATHDNPTPGVKASEGLAGLSIEADTAGVAGNDITIAIALGSTVGTGVATTDGVVVTGNAIVITLNAGGATVADVKTALDAHTAAAALVDVTFAGAPTDPVTAVSPAISLSGGTADNLGTPRGLTWSQTLTYSFVVNLENINDNPAVFGEATAGEGFTLVPATASVPAEITGIPEDILGGAEGTVIFTVATTDADNIADADATDTVAYTLISGVGNNDLFLVDAATGEVRFKEDSADYETAREYAVIVTATTTSTLKAGGAAATVDQTYTVRVTDTNEAPTSISLSRAALLSGSNIAGDLQVLDDDILTVAGRTNSDTHTFTLVAGDGDTDNGLFTISATGGVSFTAGGTRKAVGDSYSIRVSVADSGGETYVQALTIAEGSIFVYTDTNSNNAPNAGEQRKYSSFTDTEGNGVLAENADGSTTRILLGRVGGENAGVNSYALGVDTAANDNSDFVIDAGLLYYIGTHSGNFEANETLSLDVFAQTNATVASFTGREDVNVNGVNANGGVFHFTGATTSITGSTVTFAAGMIYSEIPGEGTAIAYTTGSGTLTANHYIWVAQNASNVWTVMTGAALPTAGAFYAIGQVNAAASAITYGGTAVTTPKTLTWAKGVIENYTVALEDVNDAPDISPPVPDVFTANINGILFTAKEGSVINAETKIAFINDSAEPFGAVFANNILTVTFDAARVAEDTFAELLALIQGVTEATNVFIISTGTGYNASADTVVLDEADTDATETDLVVAAGTPVVTTAGAGVSTAPLSVNINGIIFTAKAGSTATTVRLFNDTSLGFNVIYNATPNVLLIGFDPNVQAENTFAELLALIQGNAIVNANFDVTTGAGYVGTGATSTAVGGANTGTNFALIDPSQPSVNINGIIFTTKAGSTATTIQFGNTGSDNFNARFNTANNRLQVGYNSTEANENTLGEVLAFLQGNSVVLANFIVTTGAGYNASAASTLLTALNTNTNYALIAPQPSVNVHGLVFTLKAGGSANAATVIEFGNTDSGSFEASFKTGTNKFRINLNSGMADENTLGEVLAFLQGNSALTANFTLTTGAGYDASADSVVLDVVNGGATRYALISPAVPTGTTTATTLNINIGAPITEGVDEMLVVTEAMLNLSDQDASDKTAEGVLFGRMELSVHNVQNGRFQVNALDATTFTLDQVRSGVVTFLHDGGEQFTQVDGFATTTPFLTKFTLVATNPGKTPSSIPTDLKFAITAVNDAPGATAISTLTIAEGSTLPITEALLKTPDVDDGRDGITYTLTSVTSNGTLETLNLGANNIIGGTGADADTWVALANGGTFTQAQVFTSQVRYVNNGSEQATDSFTFTVDDGNEDGSIPAPQTFNIAITRVNDIPTRAPRVHTEFDYVGPVIAANPIGDNTIGEEDISEGQTYSITALDLGVYDPDDTPDNVTYKITELPLAAQATLQILVSGNWTDFAVNGTFTLADLNASSIRLVHLGLTPEMFTFKYTVKDDSSAESSVLTINIDPKELNDTPSDPVLGISRIDPISDVAGDTLATITTADEETTDQDLFVYALANDTDALDNEYFTIDGRDLKFKTTAQLDAEGLQLKLDGQSYQVRIAVTDTAVGTDNGQLAVTKEVTYTLPVRSFDIDWVTVVGQATSVGGVQSASLTIALDLENGVDNNNDGLADIPLTIGRFKIDPDITAVRTGGQYVVTVPADANDFGTVIVTQMGSPNQQIFTIQFRTNLDSPILRALEEDEQLTARFNLEVRYIPVGSTEADGFRRSIEPFSITFTGKNDPPVASDPDLIVYEATNLDGEANGKWEFSDPDTGQVIQAQGLRASAGIGSTPISRNIVVNKDASSYNSETEVQVQGTYGSLFIKADGDWRYVRSSHTDSDVADGAIQAVPLTGAVDTFLLELSDTQSQASAPLQIDIQIVGENDAPVILFSITEAVAIVAGDNVALTEAVTESTDSGFLHADITQAAGQKVDGRWEASDVDNGAELRLFSGANEIGEIIVGTPLVFNGRYGVITFTLTAGTPPVGTWEYSLDATAEKIAHGEMPHEVFDIRVLDQFNETSNVVQLDITVTGTNDAPTGLKAGSSTEIAKVAIVDGGNIVSDAGVVAESRYNTDAAANFAITVTSLVNPTPADRSNVGTITTTEPRTDFASNDVAGVTTIHGILDALDIDRVGADGRPTSAEDLHTFEILGGSGATARHANVLFADLGVQTATNPRDYDVTDGTVTTEFKGTYGTLTLNKFSGEWTYVLDNTDVDTRGLSGTGVDIFTVRIWDEENATVTDTVRISVTGTNDAPVLALTNTNAATQDLSVFEKGGTLNAVTNADGTAGGAFMVTDDDVVDTGFLAATLSIQGRSGNSGSYTAGLAANKGAGIAGAYGTVYLKNNGTWTYEVNETNTVVQAMNLGDTLTDTFQFNVRNGTLNSNIVTVTVTVRGAEDAPVAVVDTGAVNEDSTTTGNVITNDTDVDHLTSALRVSAITGAAAGNVGSAVAGTLGTLTVQANGSYSYSANLAAADALRIGATATDTFTYTVTDPTSLVDTGTLTITVTGINDRPIGVADTGAVAEDATVTVAAGAGVLSNDTDVDVGDTHTVTTVRTGTNGAAGTVGTALIGTYGTLTLNADGGYTYIANQAAADALRINTTGTDTFSYNLTDNSGTASTNTNTNITTLIFTVTGVNDDPVAVDDTGAVAEDATLTVNAANGVLTNDTDIDTGDTRTVTAGTFTGTLGTLTLQTNGSYTYNANNANSLRVGQTGTDTFTYTVSDASGGTDTGTLRITVTGVNDAPVLTVNPTSISLDEGTDRAVTTAISTADVDTGVAAPTYTLRGTDAADFSIIAATGAISFAADPDYDNPADAGTNNVYNITLRVTDASGATDDQAIIVTVNNVSSNAPTFTSAATASAAENINAANSATVQGTALTIYTAVATPDVANTTITYALTSGTSEFGINSVTGAVWFRASPDFETTTSHTFTVSASTGASPDILTANRSVTVTITNDTSDDNAAPAIAAPTGSLSVAENTAGKTTVATVAITDDGIALTAGERGGVVLSGDARFGIEYTSGNNFNIFLKAGQTLNHETDASVALTVTATDDTSKVGTRNVTIAVTDVNELGSGLPVISDTTPIIAQTLTVNTTAMTDPDEGGALGALTVKWVHSDALTVSLGTGVSYTVQASDMNKQLVVQVSYGSGAFAETRSSLLTTAVPPPNALPTGDTSDADYDITGAVSKDAIGAAVTSGEFVATDSDGTVTGYAIQANGTYGVAVLGTDGAWTYTLTKTASAVVALTTGTLTDTFTIGATDNDGGIGTQAVTITIGTSVVLANANPGVVNTLAGTAASEIIQGGNLDDTISSGGGDDIIIGGYGDDVITLGAGVDTVVYRIASRATTVRNDDGGDTIADFNRGTDKLVFIDTDATPLADFSAFIATAKLGTPQVSIKLLGTAASYTGIQFTFTEPSKDDGPSGNAAQSGATLAITFSAALGNLTAARALLGGSSSFSFSTGILTSTGLDAVDDLFGVDNIDLLSSSDAGLTIL